MSSAPKPDAVREQELYLRTELLERIAHELRGPAGVTLGALDEIERAIPADDVNGQRALFSMARRGARRILRTAERLTRTAQLESGIVHMARSVLDVRNVVTSAAQEAEQLEARSSIRLHIQTSTDPCMAEMDAGWLGAAMSELVSQAIRSARRNVLVEVQREAEWVLVHVFDDRSSTPETPEDRFLPVNDRRDSALGWPLAKDVARAHGGELTIEAVSSEAGARAEGARTTLRLRAV